MKNLILITCLLQTALAAPQLITFKDGKVGVNFFGYHAEAGLGGGQNGQNGGLLGGLHASAGTPWGQNAAAGLGGNVNGRAAGVLYAGAQATPDVGASAVLGGDTSQGGFSGSEAYANGKVASRTQTIVAGDSHQKHDGIDEAAAANLPPQPVKENTNAIQKIRPPKKYYSSETLPHILNAVAYNSRIESSSLSSLAPLTPSTPQASILDEQSIQPLNIDATNRNGNNRNYQEFSHQHKSYNNENCKKNCLLSPALSLPSTLSPAPTTSIHSSVSLNHSNENNSNGINAKGVTDNDKTAAAILLTRTETKLRNRQRSHARHNSHPKRHRSKTIVKVVKQKQQQQQQLRQQNLSTATAAVSQQQNPYPEELLLPTEPQQKYPQIYYQQQRPVRRQLIAPPPPHPADAITPCDASKSECKSVNREVRSDVVQSALQIPIGILQSLQQSLGNLRHH